MRVQSGGAGDSGHLRDVLACSQFVGGPKLFLRGLAVAFLPDALFLSAWHIGMHRQAGGGVDSSPGGSLFSVQSVGWWPGPQSRPRSSYSSAQHMHVTEQFGVVVCVGACWFILDCGSRFGFCARYCDRVL